MNKTTLISLISLILISLFSLKALFPPGFYTSHDGEHNLIRLYHFDLALRDGQIPPRWAGTLLNGFGYPLFVFSYSMPWLIGEPFRLLGLSLVDTLKIIFILGFLFSGIFMYLWQKEIWGNPGGFLAAFLYLWAPYRFSDIFVRAAAGEATAFLFLPLVFWAIFKLSLKIHWFYIFIGSFALAGILLSHAMIFFLLIIPLGFYILFELLQARKKKTFLFSVTIMLFLGLGLSAFYLLPSIALRKFTNFNEVINKKFIEDHFVTLRQLLYSKWSYGFSMSGTINDDMSFQVGIAHWLIVFFCLGIFFLKLFFRSFKSFKTKLKSFPKIPAKYFTEGIIFLTIFLFSIFMMLEISLPFWEVLGRFFYIDFPWRYLFLSLFSASVLGGFLLKILGNNRLIFLLLILIALYTNRNHLAVNQYTFYPESFYKENQGTTNSFDEYKPKRLDNKLIEKKRPKVEILEGKGEIKLREEKSNRLVFATSSETPLKTVVNIVYFPGWNVFLDRKKHNFDYDLAQPDYTKAESKIQTKYNKGLINFSVPSGSHEIEVRFLEEKIYFWGDLISLGSLTFLLAALSYGINKQHKNNA